MLFWDTFFHFLAVSLLFIFLEKFEKSKFFSKVFLLFGLIFWALELRDGSQIVDLVEIYRSKFLLFIIVPWVSCLRSKYMICLIIFLIFQCFSFFVYSTPQPIQSDWKFEFCVFFYSGFHSPYVFKSKKMCSRDRKLSLFRRNQKD